MDNLGEGNKTQHLASLAEEGPVDGDIYSSEGEHLGSIFLESVHLLKKVPTALHFQVLVEGHWYIYKLDSIEDYDEQKPVERKD